MAADVLPLVPDTDQQVRIPPAQRRDPGAGLEPLEYIDHILERELKLTLTGVELGSERDDSMRELTETAATLYDGRIIRELIQNAYDGSGEHLRAEILVRLDLSAGKHGVLDVANSGTGFSRDDVDSIANPARSRKRPGNSIGHKGLGFRSVTLVSSDPQIYSAGNPRSGPGFDGFCFRFATPQEQLERLMRLGSEENARLAAGKAHSLQLPIPIRSPSAEVLAYAERYATLVRLPLIDQTAAKNMEAETQGLFDERAPLTLFLGRLAKLTIEKIDAKGQRVRRVFERRPKAAKNIPPIPGLVLEEVESDGRAFLVASRAMERDRFLAAVRRAIAQRHKVEKWLDWQGDPTISVALPLSSESQEGRYYAFLPLEQQTPFNGYLDAPFFPDPDRRTLSLANALNDELVNAGAEICLALLRGLAEANVSRAAEVHAAVDAISWSDTDRVFRALKSCELEPGKLPLPIVSRADTDARWSTLDRVFDWADQDHRSLKATWMAKVTGAYLLRRNMGSRRADALRSLGDKAGLSLEPDAARLAGWIPMLAKDLDRRRKATAREWENFYADLAEQTEILPQLKGTAVFRNETRKLVPAEGGTLQGGRPTQFFINAELGGTGRARKRKRLDDASLFPPSCITKGMEFADPTLAWPADVVSKFVQAGLASEFRLVQVVSKLGELLGLRPRKRDAIAVMSWAFRSWKDQRSEEFNKALKKAGIMVPLSDGGVAKADRAFFSTGWRETLGDLLHELCLETADHREFGAISKRLLPAWHDWPALPGDTAQDWRDFLRLAGVRDGLPWFRTAEVRMSWWHWRELRAGSLDRQEFERGFDDSWRAAIAAARSQPSYVSGSYVSEGIPYLLGQPRYKDLNGPAKLAYGRLVANLVGSLPDNAWSFTFSRAGPRSESIRWPSPIATFLKSAAWIPAAGHDHFSGFRAGQCWLGSRGEVPRFMPRAERSVRELIENSQKLKQILISKLDMPSWADAKSAPARIAALGEILQTGIADAYTDDFRKAAREAWGHYAGIIPRPALPPEIILAVDTRSGLEPLQISKTNKPSSTIFVDDGSRPIFQQILTALGHSTLEVPPDVETQCLEALRNDLGCEAKLIHEDALQIEVDGKPFSPSANDQLLVGNGREWIADVGVLVLEVSSRLSSQNSLSARQALSDAVRRVRLRFTERITVSVDGTACPLPVELDGILPVPDRLNPTILVEGRGLDWETLSRVAAAVPLAVGRPSLIDPFGLTFGALQTEMSRDSEWLRAPSDQQLARVLRRPVARITELLRSLRATTSRLLEFVLPVVHASGFPAACQQLEEHSDRLTDEGDIVSLLVRSGVPTPEASHIVAKCRDAETQNAVRRELGIAFPTFNRSLIALGRVPLDFRERLVDRFRTRMEQRRNELERLVRDASRESAREIEGLRAYATAVNLNWLVMPETWVSDYDDVDLVSLDLEIDNQMRARLGAGPFPTGDAPDPLRQHNRQLLAGISENLRRLVRAWSRKNNVPVPEAWQGGLEVLGRAAVTSGAFDFEKLDEDGLVAALARSPVWPAGMPVSRDLSKLDLSSDDLAFEERDEHARQERQLKERRSLKFGDTEIEGGIDGWLESVANVMEATIGSRSFKDRSGPAKLQVLGPTDPSKRRGRGGGSRNEDPQYLSQEQRDLIGFAGELAAYRYLQSKHRNMRGEHWVSSMGRRHLGLPAIEDQGFDFKVSDSRGFVHYEVKAHSSDPGYVDLERSQVTAAVAMRAEAANRWRILYVANARSPSVTVYELPNPYSDEATKLFRDSHRQGVRLAVRRA
ncbi:ATP-binding protein [Mesorhizobium sp.]|uniref:ATP-binding protein n=1 Tax=Mesorhizobium sp. TaxID=1871066 RepID=UPI000FE8E4BB|nr:ATP-binding protein [Mesorhizobium sp.]RWP51051.1 MAG: ATP-binding protein [Mesorhizobium sp.]